MKPALVQVMTCGGGLGNWLYNGINAGAEIAKILKAKQETIDKWQMAAEKKISRTKLWRENQGRFLEVSELN